MTLIVDLFLNVPNFSKMCALYLGYISWYSVYDKCFLKLWRQSSQFEGFYHAYVWWAATI